MDDAVSEIIAEYAERIDAQERIAQAEAAVVEAAMGQWAAWNAPPVTGAEYQRRAKNLDEACSALAKARGQK